MRNKTCRSPIRFRPLLTLGILLLLVGGVPAGASTSWRSDLYPENWQRPDASAAFYHDKLIQDFSYAGYKRGEEPIPNVTGPIFNVTSYGADPTGASDSTLAIQGAINAAAGAGGGVVFLPAGEFRVSPQGSSNFALRISASNIVLRGAGVAETFLLNTSPEMRGKSVLLVSPTSTSTNGFSHITADLSGPTRRIPVDNVRRFSPGGFVRLEWEFTDAWIAEHNQQTWWNVTNGRPGNARYLREVLAINSAEGWIEVDVPTRYTMKLRDNARVIPLSGLLFDVGVESLSIGNLQHPGTTWGSGDYTDPTKPAYDVHSSWLIGVQNVRDSWITDVHSKQAVENTSTSHMLSNGILVLNSYRITLRDCEMRRSQYGGGGGNGYMFRIQHSNESLLKRCVADFSRHGIVLSHAGTSGNVFLQCEDRESQRSTGHTGEYNTGASGSDNHMHFSHSNLFDQCHAHNSYYTASHRGNSGTTPHGLTSAHAVYWNTSGSGTRYNDIVRSEQGRYGYVIGTSGTRFNATNPTGGNTAPADILQGIGTGATLEPQSLYADQLSRRLEPTVIYEANGATGGTTPIDANSPYQPGATVTVLGVGDLVNTGSILSGWNTEPDGSGTNYEAASTFEITGSVILYAQWTALPYTVTFDSNGGAPADPVSIAVRFGAPYGMVATTNRSGFSFIGWFTARTGGSEVSSETTVTIAEDHPLYARWNAPPVVDAGPDQTVAILQQAPWSPAAINATAWYDAADAGSLTASDGAVSQWNDKSGNDNHLWQNELIRQPATDSSTLNGLNVLDFSQAYIFTSSGLGADIRSVFMVHANNVAITISTPAIILLSTAGDGISTGDGYGSSTGAFAGEVLSVFDEDTTAFSKRQAASSSTLPIIEAGAHLYTYALATDWFIGFDGSDDLRDLTSGTARNPMLFANSFSIGAGARQHPDRVEFFYDGSVAEVILLDTTVSQQERQTIEGYLAHKWGLAENLPVDHPFKAAAPGAPSALTALDGTASDPDHDPLTHTWSVVSGPGPVVFSNASMLNPNATFTVEGEYTLRLTSTDGFDSSSDDVVITVLPETSLLVTYDGNGETGGVVPDDTGNPYSVGQTVTVLAPGDLARIGYAFSGWNTSADATGTDYAPEATFAAYAPVTLYAKWTPNTYTVGFDTNGGNSPDPASLPVTFDATYGTLPTTSRAGFSFVGWFSTLTGETLVTDGTIVATAEDHTLDARWNATPIVHAGPDQMVALSELIAWSPAEIATAAWYDASDASTITVTGSGVSDWRDKSGNGNDAKQATDSLRPATGVASIGGHNAIRFTAVDSGGHRLSAPHHSSLELDASGGVNIFSVFNYTGFVAHGGNAVNTILAKGDTLDASVAYGIRVNSNSSLRFKSGANHQLSLGSDQLGNDLIYTGASNSTDPITYANLNGTRVTQALAKGLSDNADPLDIGGRTNSTARFSSFKMGEIIIVGGNLSKDTVQKIEGYLAHRWDLAGNLSADHPYKISAPGSLVATATLHGSATDAEEDPLTYVWSLESGPAPVSFADASALGTTATFTEEGVYTLRLTSSDGFGSSFDEVVVTVGDVDTLSPFKVWANDQSVTFTGDANGDGVADGLAWLLGAADPAQNASALAPIAAVNNGALEVHFTMLSQANRGGAYLKLQYSPDLFTWTSVTVPEQTDTLDGVDFVINSSGAFPQVKATLSFDPSIIGDRIFIRLTGQEEL
jgi:uncharacterized repeat protein (TIGR02543 family)